VVELSEDAGVVVAVELSEDAVSVGVALSEAGVVVVLSDDAVSLF
jgi:hypothetical protein